MRIELTRKIAWAVATDAANSRMRKQNRTKWNRADYNTAVATFERLWPLEIELKALRGE